MNNKYDKPTIIVPCYNEQGVLPKTAKRLALCVSVFWLVCCFVLLIPSIRNLGIRFGETLVHRSLNHFHWHQLFVTIGIYGIVLYIFFVWFLAASLFSKIASKTFDIFVMTISLIFVFIINYKAGWTFGDDIDYILTTVVNKYIPLSYTIGMGRFPPFKNLQYNFPLFVFRCLGINTGLPLEVHFAVISVLYIVTVCCLYFIFSRIDSVETAGTRSVFNCFFACTFFLLESSFSRVFLDLIYPETQVIMQFSIFMLMYYKALRTDKIRYYAIALLSAIFSTYCKEPVFGVFLIIAFINYLFRYKEKSEREKVFYIALIANGIIFIILYYFLSYKKATILYTENKTSIIGFKFLLSIFIRSPILIIMFTFGLFRLYSIIVRKNRDHLFYDSLLFAGIGYVFAFIVLHFNMSYYFLPSIILFLPSIVYWIKYLSYHRRVFSVALFIILLIYTYNSGKTVEQIRITLRERQEFMPYMVNLFSAHNDGKEFIWYESDNRKNDNTFYIHVRNWRKHNINTFLNYINKSEGKDFFVVEKNTDNINMKKNIYFFYPAENDQYDPMQDKLIKILQNNNFVLYKDAYGILIYRQH